MNIISGNREAAKEFSEILVKRRQGGRIFHVNLTDRYILALNPLEVIQSDPELQQQNFRQLAQRARELEPEFNSEEAAIVAQEMAGMALKHVENRRKGFCIFKPLSIFSECLINFYQSSRFNTTSLLAFELRDRLIQKAVQNVVKDETSPKSSLSKPYVTAAAPFPKASSKVVPSLKLNRVITGLQDGTRTNTSSNVFKRKGSSVLHVETYKAVLTRDEKVPLTSREELAIKGVFQNMKRFYGHVDDSLLDRIKMITDSFTVNLSSSEALQVVSDMIMEGPPPFYGEGFFRDIVTYVFGHSTFNKVSLEQCLNAVIEKHCIAEDKSGYDFLLNSLIKKNEELKEQGKDCLGDNCHLFVIARILTGRKKLKEEIKEHLPALKKLIGEASLPRLQNYSVFIHASPELVECALEACVDKFTQAKEISKKMIDDFLKNSSHINFHAANNPKKIQAAFFLHNPQLNCDFLDLSLPNSMNILRFIFLKLTPFDLKMCLKKMFTCPEYNPEFFKMALEVAIKKYEKDDAYSQHVEQLMANRKLMMMQNRKVEFLSHDSSIIQIAQSIVDYKSPLNKKKPKVLPDLSKLRFSSDRDTHVAPPTPHLSYSSDRPEELPAMYKNQLKKYGTCDPILRKTVFSSILSIDEGGTLDCALGLIRHLTGTIEINLADALTRRIFLDLIDKTNIHVCERMYSWLKAENRMDPEIITALILALMNKYQVAKQPINKEVLKGLMLSYGKIIEHSKLSLNSDDIINSVKILLEHEPSDPKLKALIELFIQQPKYDEKCKTVWIGVYETKQNSDQQKDLKVAVDYPILRILQDSVPKE